MKPSDVTDSRDWSVATTDKGQSKGGGAMAKRRHGARAYKRAIQIRWKQFLRRFEQEKRRRRQEQETAKKIVETAGLICVAVICAG